MIENLPNLDVFTDFNPYCLAHYDTRVFVHLLFNDLSKATEEQTQLLSRQFAIGLTSAKEAAELSFLPLTTKDPQKQLDAFYVSNEIISSASGRLYPADVVSYIDLELMKLDANPRANSTLKMALYQEKLGIIYDRSPESFEKPVLERYFCRNAFHKALLDPFTINLQHQTNLFRRGTTKYYEQLKSIISP